MKLFHELREPEHEKHWFDEELFLGLMRIRGMEGATRVRGGVHVPEVVAVSNDLLGHRHRGVWVIEPERLEDERGFFAGPGTPTSSRARAQRRPRPVQHLVQPCARDAPRPALPGRAARGGEARAVHVGALFDVALDLRPDSSTYGEWFGVELSADNRKALYVPEGCAHGFMTLEDGCEVHYQISEAYARRRSGVFVGTTRRSRSSGRATSS